MAKGQQAAQTSAPSVDRRAKFVELATGRVNKAINAINAVGKLANKKAYEYGEDDIKQINNAIETATTQATERFFASLSGAAAPTSAGFSFTDPAPEKED